MITFSRKNSLRQKILSGAGWNFFHLIAAQGIKFLVKLILARLLLPEHFGIVGMAVIITSLLEIFGDFGFTAALVQFSHKDLRKIHLDTAFWLSLLINGAIYSLLFFFITPLGAWFFQEPLLNSVIPVLGISICLSPLSLIHRVLLTRELRFKPLSLTESTASLASGIIAVLLALSDAGIWSLVLHTLLSTALAVPVFWFLVEWRPRFMFSREASKEILNFGVFFAAQRGLIFGTKYLDFIIIGKLVGAEALGAYTLAFLLTRKIRRHIISVLEKVMFPVYGRIKHEPARIKKYYLLTVKYYTLFIFPYLAILFFHAPVLVESLFGEIWLDAGLTVRLLCLAVAIEVTGGHPNSILKGMGMAKLGFKIYFLLTVFIALPGMTAGAYYFGLEGVAAVVVVYQFCARIIFHYYLKKIINVNLMNIFYAVLPGLSCIIIFSALHSASMLFIRDESIEFTIIAVFAGLIIYLLLMFSFFKHKFPEISQLFGKRG